MLHTRTRGMKMGSLGWTVEEQETEERENEEWKPMNRIRRRLYRLCWLLALLPGLPVAAAAAGPAVGESPPRGQEPAASSGREEAEVTLRSIRLVSLAAKEQRAVIRTADLKLVVVRVGEPLDSAPGWTVSEILGDRIVLDDGGHFLAGPRQAWIFEPERPGEPSRVVLIDRRPPEKEIAPKPISSSTPTAPNDQL